MLEDKSLSLIILEELCLRELHCNSVALAKERMYDDDIDPIYAAKTHGIPRLE